MNVTYVSFAMFVQTVGHIYKIRIRKIVNL